MDSVKTDDEVEATIRVQEVEGTVECQHCLYWGSMQGYIPIDDDKYILFVCPKCNGVERVINPLAV